MFHSLGSSQNLQRLLRPERMRMEFFLPLSATLSHFILILPPNQYTPFKSLTQNVVQEALESRNTGMIVSYHPPIFKPLKSFTLTNPIQNSLLTCAAEGISIYSPHTALDCVKGGINDWLAHGVLGYTPAEARIHVKDVEPKSAIRILGEIKGEGAGIGRLVSLSGGVPVSIGGLATRMKAFLNLQHGTFSDAVQSQMTLIIQ